MKVVVTGATGFVGSALVTALRGRRDDVRVLRGADLESPGPWCDALAGTDAIVHLAGEPIAGKRWDARQKQIIRDSRIETTRTIVEALGKLDNRPRALVTASGVDYYAPAIAGLDDDDEIAETAPAGSEDKTRRWDNNPRPAPDVSDNWDLKEHFLSRLCRDWEAEARAAEALGMRVVAMRMGIVLGKGGALAEMQRPLRSGRLGSGKQWMSWIHIADAIAAYLAALDDTRCTGAINIVTDSTRNADFAKALNRALHRSFAPPAPAFALKLAVGEMAEALLHGRRVVPARLRELGFSWKYPTLPAALAEIFA